MTMIASTTRETLRRAVLAMSAVSFTVTSMWRRRSGARLLLLVAAASAVTGCSGGSDYSVGDTGPGGGVVFHVSADPFPCGPDLESFCTTLEAAPLADDVERPWVEEDYTSSDVRGAGRTAIGSGWANTRDILAQGNTDPVTSAAAYADAYERNGYTDWYLPSKDEIFELWQYFADTGALPGRDYWSSTEYVLNSAWTQHAGSGPQYRRMKPNIIHVRPVRAF